MYNFLATEEETLPQFNLDIMTCDRSLLPEIFFGKQQLCSVDSFSETDFVDEKIPQKTEAAPFIEQKLFIPLQPELSLKSVEKKIHKTILK